MTNLAEIFADDELFATNKFKDAVQAYCSNNPNIFAAEKWATIGVAEDIAFSILNCTADNESICVDVLVGYKEVEKTSCVGVAFSADCLKRCKLTIAKIDGGIAIQDDTDSD